MPNDLANRPDIYFSAVDGVVIGWDLCGVCHRSLRRCDCDGGPAEPAFIAAQRRANDPPFGPAHLSQSA